MNTLPELFSAATVIAFIVMSVLWLVQRRTHNAGIVDIGWSGTIPLLVALAAWLQPESLSTRAMMAVFMAVAWGVRLAWHIHKRSCGKPEDARYADLRRTWTRNTQFKFFLFFQFQAFAAVLFCLPFFIALNHRSAELHVLETAGFLLWLLAWFGEIASDRQLSRFKNDPSSRGKVCDVGWWKYSRHPNYFFEWLIWVSLSVFAWPSPHGPWALICPLLMLFFLFKVTGIPATEEQALKSRGEAYRLYQRTTSIFVPMPKRRL